MDDSLDGFVGNTNMNAEYTRFTIVLVDQIEEEMTELAA
jgi:hypothetical protein